MLHFQNNVARRQEPNYVAVTEQVWHTAKKFQKEYKEMMKFVEKSCVLRFKNFVILTMVRDYNLTIHSSG